MALSTLCEVCRQFFVGRWMEKEPWDLARLSSSQLDLGDISDEASLATSSFDDNEWRPDWVKVAEGTLEEANILELEPSALFSPSHHTIEDLEKSAHGGCILCTSLTDIVHDKVIESDVPTEDMISRAIVRPNSGNSIPADAVDLEISYFANQEITESSWRFNANILLLPHQRSPSQTVTQTCLTEDSNARIRQSTLDQIQSWISDCSKNHQDCEMRIQSSVKTHEKLPARLLYVDSSLDYPLLRLVETAALKTDIRYATLSHCWGQAPMIRLVGNRYEKFTENIDFEALPKTFRDAVLFTESLGLQYLWIDSLCIIQDSKEDWAREASRMCSVYSNSWVTFAATSSTDGSGGLFHARNPLLTQPCKIEATWTGHKPGLYLCVDQSAWERRVQYGALNKRGWVLQEKLLAPRTIHFAYDQLWWSCADTDPCCNETYPEGVPDQSQINREPDPLTLIRVFAEQHDMVSCNDFWLAIVREYTQRELTYSSDKLIALSGVAEAAMHCMGLSSDCYLAGLWKSSLMVDLNWRMARTGKRPDTYIAPSWSWASVNGDVYFYSRKLRQVKGQTGVDGESLCATLLEAKVTPVQDPLGLVQSGYLIVRGPLLKVKISMPETTSPENCSLGELHIADTVYEAGSGFEEVLDHNPMYFDWPENGKQVYVACLTTTAKEQNTGEHVSDGLILERNWEPPGEYRRIGWIRIFHSLPGASFFASAADKFVLSADEYLRRDTKHDYVYKVV